MFISYKMEQARDDTMEMTSLEFHSLKIVFTEIAAGFKGKPQVSN